MNPQAKHGGRVYYIWPCGFLFLQHANGIWSKRRIICQLEKNKTIILNVWLCPDSRVNIFWHLIFWPWNKTFKHLFSLSCFQFQVERFYTTEMRQYLYTDKDLEGPFQWENRGIWWFCFGHLHFIDSDILPQVNSAKSAEGGVWRQTERFKYLTSCSYKTNMRYIYVPHICLLFYAMAFNGRLHTV